MPMHLRVGLRGEQLAARELRRRGYTICASNFATAVGETDIVALSPEGDLCFVEVKTRSPGGMLPPSEAVDAEKQNRLVNNAAAFLKHFDQEYRAVRFDIAEVILHDFYHADINFLENVFGEDAFPEQRNK